MRKPLIMLQNYSELVKIKLSLLVWLSSLTGFFLADGRSFHFLLFLSFSLGSLFVIGGANVFNEIIEIKEDAVMSRTSRRPLPSGRMEVAEAFIFGVCLALSGLLILAFTVNLLTGFLASLALVLYVFVYTPSKKIGSWCIAAGAVPGALPAMMGPAAVQDHISPLAWLLFGIVFFWQFPHFFAIAWLSKEDYEKAGFRIFPVPQNERLIAYEILICSCVLVGVSPLLTFTHVTGASYFIGSLILSSLLLIYALRFWLKLSKPLAGQLMRAALVYLPFLFVLMVLDKVGH
jgi:protoheme IX farnesyltransferase